MRNILPIIAILFIIACQPKPKVRNSFSMKPSTSTKMTNEYILKCHDKLINKNVLKEYKSRAKGEFINKYKADNLTIYSTDFEKKLAVIFDESNRPVWAGAFVLPVKQNGKIVALLLGRSAIYPPDYDLYNTGTSYCYDLLIKNKTSWSFKRLNNLCILDASPEEIVCDINNDGDDELLSINVDQSYTLCTKSNKGFRISLVLNKPYLPADKGVSELARIALPSEANALISGVGVQKQNDSLMIYIEQQNEKLVFGTISKDSQTDHWLFRECCENIKSRHP